MSLCEFHDLLNEMMPCHPKDRQGKSSQVPNENKYRLTGIRMTATDNPAMTVANMEGNPQTKWLLLLGPQSSQHFLGLRADVSSVRIP